MPSPSAQDFRAYTGALWRIVEGQHRISTNRLASDTAAQARLEELVEEVKPTLPRAAQDLHFLLGAPFRYWHGRATRFRSAHIKPGIFYASESEETALAETAYWRMRFFAASPDAALPSTTMEHSAFCVTVTTGHALDLTCPPLDAGKASWTDPDDYTACQTLGNEARALDTDLIVYESVRALNGARNAAVLNPAIFTGQPQIRTSWHLRFDGDRLTAQAAFPAQRVLEYRPAEFQLAAMRSISG